MLTQAQIDQFHRDGFLRIPKVFSGDELKLLRAAADQVVSDGVAGVGEHHLYQEVKGKKTYFRSEKMWSRGDIFRAVTVNPGLLSAIGQCTGESFMPMNDSFVCKTPRSMVPINWHQDPPYGNARDYPVTQSTPNFDTDIYLDHSTIANGCVWGIPGHHLVGNVSLGDKTQDELFEKYGAVPIEMEPGDVLFHCLSAPHGSVGNPTDTTRRIFYVHYMPRFVAEHTYSFWKTSKSDRGWNDMGFDLVEDMFAARQRLGLATDLDAERTHYERHVGVYFEGQPCTPYKHWGTLVRQMCAGEIAAKKALRYLTPAAV